MTAMRPWQAWTDQPISGAWNEHKALTEAEGHGILTVKLHRTAGRAVESNRAGLGAEWVVPGRARDLR
jgi:hypothetical protein